LKKYTEYDHLIVVKKVWLRLKNGDILASKACLAHGEMLSALWNSRDGANVKENPFDIGKIIIRNSYP
jgi:hypothetical protein